MLYALYHLGNWVGIAAPAIVSAICIIYYNLNLHSCSAGT